MCDPIDAILNVDIIRSTYSPGMSRSMSTSICLPSIGRLGRSQSAFSCESQISKYAFLCYVFQLVTNNRPWRQTT